MDKAWTTELDGRVIDMWQQDMTATDIATALGRTPGSIHQRARRLGLGRRKQPIVSRVSGDGKGTWTAEEDALIAELRRTGHRTSAIAVILGRSYAGVKSREQKILDNSRVSTSPQKLRKCLGDGCGTMFLSTGPGNRLCGECRPRAGYSCGQYD